MPLRTPPIDSCIPSIPLIVYLMCLWALLTGLESIVFCSFVNAAKGGATVELFISSAALIIPTFNTGLNIFLFLFMPSLDLPHQEEQRALFGAVGIMSAMMVLIAV